MKLMFKGFSNAQGFAVFEFTLNVETSEGDGPLLVQVGKHKKYPNDPKPDHAKAGVSTYVIIALPTLSVSKDLVDVYIETRQGLKWSGKVAQEGVPELILRVW